MVGAPDCKDKHNKYYSSKSLVDSKNNFRYYLTGLWEGDGHIWIPQNSHAPSGKRYTPHFTITFDKRDINLAIRLKSILGGTVSDKRPVNACTLTISRKKGLEIVVEIINGKVRTPKYKRFIDLITWMNSNYNSKITIREIDKSDLLRNAWLRGFIDADGSFSVSIRKKSIDGKGKNRVESRFRLEQRQKDPKTNSSYVYIIEDIAKTFVVTNKITRHNFGKEYYVVSVSRPGKLIKLISYLDTFPLFSSKRINYLDFKKSVEIILKKEYLFYIERFVEIKNNINNKRVYFNWENLDKLNNY